MKTTNESTEIIRNASNQEPDGPPIMDVSIRNEPDAKQFFEEIIAFKKRKSNESKFIAIIVVSHMVYDLLLFLKALESVGTISKIIFKSSHKNEKIYNEIQAAYPNELTPNITKERLKDDIASIYDIVRTTDNDKKILIIDIGGYFAPCLPIISKDSNLAYKFLGIVEDTENGHQKYQKHIRESKIPIFSVARCQQKRTEDYNVGKSIVNTADMLLKNIQVRTEELFCGVIGFGKIGSSIADHLRQKRVGKLLVYDRDPVVLMRAASLDFRIASKDDILSKCSMIYCATGQKSLSLVDLENIGNEKVYIASCTSSDDEFACNVKNFHKDIKNAGQVNQVDISVYKSKKDNEIVFLANGNAVNFYLKNNALGDYIRGVQAAILVAALKLINGETKPSIINEITYDEEKVISRLWLKHFHKLDYRISHEFLLKSKDKQRFIRDSDVEKIETMLEKNSYCCIFGENGTGKTELARRVAQKNEDYYEIIWYIDQSKKETAYKEIAKKLNITLANCSEEEIPQEIFLKLAGKNSFLIIFDNLTENSEIKNILRAFKEFSRKNATHFDDTNNTEIRSHIIMLTKNTPANKTIKAEKSLKINPLSVEDIEKILGIIYPKLSQEANLLHSLSTGNPFLLDKIISYVSYQETDAKAYETQFCQTQNNNTSLSAEQLQDRIVGMSLARIEEAKENGQSLAYDFILLSALLDGERIQPELYEYIFRNIYKLTVDEKLRHAKVLLEKYGLLETWHLSSKKSRNPYLMRELTQNIIIRTHLKNDFSSYFFITLEAVNHFFHYNSHESHVNLETCKKYISHAHSLIDKLIESEKKDIFYQECDSQNILKLTNFLYQLASIYLCEYRDYKRSLRYFQIIQELINSQPKDSEKLKDSEIRKIRTMVVNGIIINSSRLYGETEKKDNEEITYFEENLQKLQSYTTEKSFKEIDDDRLKANMLINESYIEKHLGLLYIENKQFNQGNVYLKNALQILDKLKQAFSSDMDDQKDKFMSQSMAFTYHALGSLNLALHKYNLYQESSKKFIDDAIASLKEAIEQREKILDSTHPDLARSKYKYSKALWKKYKEDKKINAENSKLRLLDALKYCKAALFAQKQSLSADHLNLEQSKKLKIKIKQKLNQAIDKKNNFAVSPPYTTGSEHKKSLMKHPSQTTSSLKPKDLFMSAPKTENSSPSFLPRMEGSNDNSALNSTSQQEMTITKVLTKRGIGGGAVTTGLNTLTHSTLETDKTQTGTKENAENPTPQP